MGSLFFDASILGVEEAETRRRREDQSHGAARERLLRALPGTETSVGNTDGGGEWVVMAEEEVSAETAVAAGAVLVVGMKWRSSVENDSSTKFDNHSSSAKSSYCKKEKTINYTEIGYLRINLNFSSCNCKCQKKTRP